MRIPPQFRNTPIDINITTNIGAIIPTSCTIIIDIIVITAIIYITNYRFNRLVKIFPMREHNLTKCIDIPFPAIIVFC